MAGSSISFFLNLLSEKWEITIKVHEQELEAALFPTFCAA
jgi:hypothetical protein